MFEKTLPNLAKETVLLASSLNKKIATAESCTGGELASLITSIAGSSKVYEAGFVTYSNKAKADMLSVSLHNLELYGAVSVEVAKEMAKGVYDKSGADIAIAITGIAGPAGGSDEKPVGTVCIGLYTYNIEIADMYFFDGGRAKIREQSCRKALEIILTKLNYLKK